MASRSRDADGGNSFSWLLENIVRVHSSVYGWDKTVKIFSYACGLAANHFARTKGPDSDLAVGLQQASSHFALWRMCGRLAGGPFGLPAEIDNITHNRWSGGWKDPVISHCNILQSWTMVVYYPLEHILWASAAIPRLFKLNPKLEDNISRFSCVWWVLWLLIDLYAIKRRLAELARMREDLRQKGLLNARTQEILDKKKVDIYIHLARILLFLPNAVNWTLPAGHKYCLAPWLVNLFGISEGIVGMISFAQGRGPSCPTLPAP